jgi:glucose-6-phosphate 1-dehydrogenase
MTYLNNKKFFRNDEADFAWQIGYTNNNKVNTNKPKPSIYDNIQLEPSSGKKLF